MPLCQRDAAVGGAEYSGRQRLKTGVMLIALHPQALGSRTIEEAEAARQKR
jgi:hypothetical protein